MEHRLEPLLSFDNVGLRYPGAERETLKNISFVINKGDFYFLTGKSGAGKSSLLKLMDMSMRPTRGIIEIFGKDAGMLKGKQISHLRRRIGVIFQDYKLISNLTVADNVALPLKIINKPEDQAEAALKEILGFCKLLPFKDKYPLSLSGGQQQLVALARAVITDPSIILADEATASIDEATSASIMELFLALNSYGTTIIFATHNGSLIKKYKRNVLVLNGGKLSTKTHREWTSATIYE